VSAAFFTTRVANSAAEIHAAAWNACANPAGSLDCHPFTRHEFFAALEMSGSASPETGWQPFHLVLERDGAVVAILPLYLKGHSFGEYVFDQGWADALERVGGRYYPKLQSSVPFTPVAGRRLLVAASADQEEAQQLLLSAGAEAANGLGVSSLHITFMTKTEWAAAAACGYLLRTDQQFHWENDGYSSFDAFVGELSSSRRKNMRKERAAVREAGITFEWLTGSDLQEWHWDAFYEFYIETGSRKWGRPYLTREFFSRIGADMGESILLILAHRARRPIAGALNFMGEGVLYGRNWGASEFVPFLHFETCYYQAIEFAIAKRLRKVEAGAQGAHKLLRGYRPIAMHSAHYIRHQGLRDAVARYLSSERERVSSEIERASAATPFRKPG
jgi:predicted N-acyltransferase